MQDKSPMPTIFAIIFAIFFVFVFGYAGVLITGKHAYLQERITYQGQEISLQDVESILKSDPSKIAIVLSNNPTQEEIEAAAILACAVSPASCASQVAKSTVISTNTPTQSLNPSTPAYSFVNNKYTQQVPINVGTQNNPLYVLLPPPPAWVSMNPPAPTTTAQIQFVTPTPKIIYEKHLDLTKKYNLFVIVGKPNLLDLFGGYKYFPCNSETPVILANPKTIMGTELGLIIPCNPLLFAKKLRQGTLQFDKKIIAYLSDKTIEYSKCGNAICEPDESPSSCQEDCTLSLEKIEKALAQIYSSVGAKPVSTERIAFKISTWDQCTIEKVFINELSAQVIKPANLALSKTTVPGQAISQSPSQTHPIPTKGTSIPSSKQKTTIEVKIPTNLQEGRLVARINAICNNKKTSLLADLGNHYFTKLIEHDITGSTYYYISSSTTTDSYGNTVYIANYEDQQGNTYQVNIIWNGGSNLNDYLNDFKNKGYSTNFDQTKFIYEITDPSNPSFQEFLWQSSNHLVLIEGNIKTGSNGRGLVKVYLIAYPSSTIPAVPVVQALPTTPATPIAQPLPTTPVTQSSQTTIRLIPLSPTYFRTEVGKTFYIEMEAANLGNTTSTFMWDPDWSNTTCSVDNHGFVQPSGQNYADIQPGQKVRIKTKATIKTPASFCKFSYKIYDINNISNSYILTFYIYAYSPNQITLSLKKGFNLISFPFYMDMAFNDFNNLAAGKIASIWGYSPGTGWQVWHSDPSIPSTPNFDRFEPGYAYWVNASDSINVVVTATKPQPTIPQIYANTGWNLIGLAVPYPIEASTYLKSLANNCEAIYHLNPTTGILEPIQKTTNLMPGEGYWFYFNASGVIYP